MSEVNLLEGLENLEISEEQADTLAFAISSKAIKEYIDENEKEYEEWLEEEYEQKLAEVYFTELIFGKSA